MIEMKLLFANLAKLQHDLQYNGIWNSYLVFDALREANNVTFFYEILIRWYKKR